MASLASSPSFFAEGPRRPFRVLYCSGDFPKGLELPLRQLSQLSQEVSTHPGEESSNFQGWVRRSRSEFFTGVEIR